MLGRFKRGSRSGMLLTLVFGTILLVPWSGKAWWPRAQKPDSMPGMDMSGRSGQQVGTVEVMTMSKGEMRKMGSSMEAMAGHMIMTMSRPEQPGDKEKAQAVVASAKATMARYKDYRNALADGYVIANPKVEQLQYHFNNDEFAREADVHFDPSKPTSLLYRRTPHQSFALEGVMYTASPLATPDELNRRIPLSIVHWHEHVNFCAAPKDRVREYFGNHPTFGMFGSIHTKDACDAAHGNFYPIIFNWMIHVFPYEKEFKEVFSMNDDVPHVQVRN